MILIVDNHDSFVFNLARLFVLEGHQIKVLRNDCLSVDEALSFSPQAIILSPGPYTPKEAGICCALVRACPTHIPLLGVCLGHQAIISAFGGKINKARAPRFGVTTPILRRKDPLFAGLPAVFTAGLYHALVGKDLPEQLMCIAWDRNKQVMAVRHRERPIYGVQFHPESVMTRHGRRMIANFLALRVSHALA